ncbi:phospholipase A2 A2-actitoxin-Cgg2a-like [Apostichopus japonicus]|uniref:phospholipase A2 A2-actitoxin-Cgg2a-like n=1 Tax=Stichopus japonicus TaxID=307972 RepID=UPI003AB44719
MVMDFRPFCLVLLFALLFSNASGATGSSDRIRRSLRDLAELIECETGRDARDYINYGCWCGVGGSEDPVDQVDQCCHDHDHCYDELLDSRTCHGLDVYDTTYNLPFTEEGCSAGIQISTCSVANSRNKCGRGLCRCDVHLAMCLSSAVFDPYYYKYSRFIGCSFRGLIHSVQNVFP